MSRRPKIVLLGMMTKMPVAGVVWQNLHYLVGFERLGYETYYVEAHARVPSMFMKTELDHGSGKAAEFLDRVMRRFDFGDRWAFHALHEDRRCYGMSEERLAALYRDAALIINLHGGTEPLPEHSARGRLVYVETDPGQLQIELHERLQSTIDFLDPHSGFFTFAENYGAPDCLLPVDDRFVFRPTRQPVVADFWRASSPPRDTFTTVGNWYQPWRAVRLNGETYGWSKHDEFLKFIDLPGRTEQELELALSGCSEHDRLLLEKKGWRVCDGLSLSTEPDAYRDYIRSSRAEFTVAKDQNVRLRSGWFSDRSATYLASARPVVTQDTGFSSVFPTGVGLFAFTTMAEILEATTAIRSDYDRHSRAARDLAREFFEAGKVLGRLLEDVRIEQGSRGRGKGESIPRPVGLPIDLDLTVVSRRPTTLTDETVARILSHPIRPLRRTVAPLNQITRKVSIVIPTSDNHLFLRLCLESILANTGTPSYEIVVVEDRSSDDVHAYLRSLSLANRRVRVVPNERGRGFSGATNQGLTLADGECLVILNDDTIVPPGWLRMLRHLHEPTTGLVGPVTNRADGDAQIDVPYSTYGDFLTFARDRARRFDRVTSKPSRLTMFCAALRRDVYETVGPLDETFEVGQFEDDDYELRLREAGYRILIAGDVVVHHFGGASLGRLVASGEYQSIFRANRRYFESKWLRKWERRSGRPPDAYTAMRDRLRAILKKLLPPGAKVAVASRGDEEMIKLTGSVGWHFPQEADGSFAGHYPADSEAAISHLNLMRQKGATFLVFPETARWWLAHYAELDAYLRESCNLILDETGTCIVFGL